MIILFGGVFLLLYVTFWALVASAYIAWYTSVFVFAAAYLALKGVFYAGRAILRKVKAHRACKAPVNPGSGPRDWTPSR